MTEPLVVTSIDLLSKTSVALTPASVYVVAPSCVTVAPPATVITGDVLSTVVTTTSVEAESVPSVAVTVRVYFVVESVFSALAEEIAPVFELIEKRPLSFPPVIAKDVVSYASISIIAEPTSAVLSTDAL